MARHNYVHLLGVIQKKPMIQTDAEGNYKMGIMFIKVTRGPRSVGDNRYTTKYDEPVIMTREPEMVKQMAEFDVNDFVEVKGTIAVLYPINKTSSCPYCNTKNATQGVLVYINPIHFLKLRHCETEEEINEYLQQCSEISNEIMCFCTLVSQPKKVTPKNGMTITQYQVALNRKYRIRTDSPDITADYPWVKAYGENAENDRERLHKGSEIYVDGCIQARAVNRHAVCSNCGQTYDWKDKAMEIVPFANEYVSNYYSDEEIEQRKQELIEQAKQSIFKTLKNNPDDAGSADDEITEEDIEAGIDTLK